METDLNEQEIRLLLVIQRLGRTHQALTRQDITALAEIKFPHVAEHYDQLIIGLREKGLLGGGQDDPTLTAEGDALAQRYSMAALFYDDYYQAVLPSRAHALFCERVYGLDLAQHGTADMAQIALLLDEIQIGPGMTVLDFGCGDGRIAEYLSDGTGACVTGLDIAAHAIELAQQRTVSKRERLRFVCANLEETPGALPIAAFDRIIAIDSIFFAQDQRIMLERLLKLLKPGGRLGIFYLAPPVPAPDAHQTVLGQALAASGLHYSIHDLAAQNFRHWTTKRAVLQELEPLFHEEGNVFLFKNRMAECQGEPERFQRYLFIVKID